jgi:D-alanine-D-alanine ligase
VFLDRDGAWWVTGAPLGKGEEMGSGFRRPDMHALRPGAAIAALVERGVSVVFPVLHGTHGEDGTVQGMCELHDLPCVGAGCAASAVAMDKIRTRECLAFAGVPMPEAYIARAPLAAADAAAESAAIAATVGFPCFLKVDTSGSSVGVARAEGPEDVGRFLDECRGLGRRFLAERAIVGEEISVPVLGNVGFELTALPPIGIYPRFEAYFTKRAKYVAGQTEEVVPPRGMADEAVRAAQDLAVRCHEAVQCDGMSRTDMIVRQDGPLVLEVNTIPGLTRTSLLPQSARAAGIEFPALLDRLIELALARALSRDHLPEHGRRGHRASMAAGRPRSRDGAAS